MSACGYTYYRSPFGPEVPEEARRLNEEASTAYEQRQRQTSEARARKLGEIAEAARGRIRDLVGAENWASLRQLMKKERLSFRELWQPPEGLTLDFDGANRARKERGHAFLQSLGVSKERLSAIGRDFAEQTHELFDTPGPPNTTGLAVATHFEDIRHFPIYHHFPPEDPHRFFVFKPPFDDGQMGWDPALETGAFRVARHVLLDTSAGLVGHDVTLDIDSARDADGACAVADTQIAFLFKAPTAGIVEVFIKAQSGLAVHELRTEDEWGWSDSKTDQRNFLMMHVIHPNITQPSLALMSHFAWNTDASEFVRREFLTRGGDFVARLFSDGPLPGGQLVEIRVGTKTRDWAFTNDVELHSKSSFHWFIKEVHVRIAP